nr:hypothetical protein Iba_chr03eCG5790 [Ipomoea batatas]
MVGIPRVLCDMDGVQRQGSVCPLYSLFSFVVFSLLALGCPSPPPPSVFCTSSPSAGFGPTTSSLWALPIPFLHHRQHFLLEMNGELGFVSYAIREEKGRSFFMFYARIGIPKSFIFPLCE